MRHEKRGVRHEKRGERAERVSHPGRRDGRNAESTFGEELGQLRFHLVQMQRQVQKLLPQGLVLERQNILILHNLTPHKLASGRARYTPALQTLCQQLRASDPRGALPLQDPDQSLEDAGGTATLCEVLPKRQIALVAARDVAIRGGREGGHLVRAHCAVCWPLDDQVVRHGRSRAGSGAFATSATRAQRSDSSGETVGNRCEDSHTKNTNAPYSGE